MSTTYSNLNSESVHAAIVQYIQHLEQFPPPCLISQQENGFGGPGWI